MTTALHHKILANYHGRLADQYTDQGDSAAAACHYAQEAYHLEQRAALGRQPGGRQLSLAAAASYAAKHAA